MKHRHAATKVKRDSALNRTELRQQARYISVDDRLPEIGMPVIGFAHDGRGEYRIPFPIIYRGGVLWSNVKCERTLAVKIVGWLCLT